MRRNIETRITALEQYKGPERFGIEVRWLDEAGHQVATTAALPGPVDYRKGLFSELVDVHTGATLARLQPGYLEALLSNEGGDCE